MTPRPEQPEPYLRGVPYPAYGDVPYPRANPTDTSRLPADVWHAAVVPVGVRIEVVGDAEAIDVGYRTTSGNLGYRGDGAGITFSVWRAGHQVCEEEATLGDGMVRLPLGASPPDRPAIVYIPEGMQPLIQSVTAVNGEIAPAPAQPRWVAYGDSVTQGWIASGPSQAWAAIAARKAGLDLVNLGYAGAARGEIVSAEHVAELPADIVTIAYGTNCWTRTPHSLGMVAEGLRGFLDIVRKGHPAVPVVVVSPMIRPDAEHTPNKLGVTLSDIRSVIETVTRERMDGGDSTLRLVEGAGIINTSHLEDGIHPGNEGHKRIAASVVKVLTASLKAALAVSAAQATAGRVAADLGEGREDEGEADGTDDAPLSEPGVSGSRSADPVDPVDPVDPADAADPVGADERAGTDDPAAGAADPLVEEPGDETDRASTSTAS